MTQHFINAKMIKGCLKVEQKNRKLFLSDSNSLRCFSLHSLHEGLTKEMDTFCTPYLMLKRVFWTYVFVILSHLKKSWCQTTSPSLLFWTQLSLVSYMRGLFSFNLGNNTFGEEIRQVLEKIGSSEERTAYILMERIHPAPLRNYALRPTHEIELCDMVSELGIFGIIVG